jgi:hypothetical protein
MEDEVTGNSIEQWVESFEGEERERRRASAIDLFNIRAKDYSENFFSLRGIEWTVVYQLLAGLALIGGAYTQMPGDLKEEILARIGFFALATISFIGWVFLAWQIQRRLHWTRAMQDAYLDGIQKSLLGVPRPLGPPNPRFPRWYAFVVQFCIALAVYVAIAAYICLARAESSGSLFRNVASIAVAPNTR